MKLYEIIRSDDEYILPKHVSCASHTLSLIGTTDIRNIKDNIYIYITSRYLL